jgi:hypothetical protein
MFSKLFTKTKPEQRSVEGAIERCSSQYTLNYGAFLILLKNDDHLYSIGPDQYINPEILLSYPGDSVSIESTLNHDGVWKINKIINHTLEERLGKIIPRWAYCKEDSRTEHNVHIV